MRVTVDQDRCLGHGLCCSTMPEWFALDPDTGRARPRGDVVATELEEWMLATANTCPEGAIELTDR